MIERHVEVRAVTIDVEGAVLRLPLRIVEKNLDEEPGARSVTLTDT